ncbi:MAG: oligopeptide/dipeptide ABC transporter ATP-binding protein [Nitrospira sp.]
MSGATSANDEVADGQWLLECQSLVRHFPVKGSKKVVQAVNDVTLRFGRGETVALVGESGSGKSTVGRMILGLLKPTSGAMHYEGRSLASMSEMERRRYRAGVQAVFQDPLDSLDPRQRVATSVREPLVRLRLAKSRSDARERTLRVIELVGLDSGVLDAYPHELSGSIQQRVGIARALVTEPRFIVLDEPTSSLSPIARADVMGTLRNVQEVTGVSYLFITHDLAVVESLAHRVAVMYLGRIVEDGPAADVFERRVHPYTAALLASVLFPEVDETPSFAVLRGEIPSPIDLPTGCAFASRCSHVIPECRRDVPDLLPMAQYPDVAHAVACRRRDELAAEEGAQRLLAIATEGRNQ